MKLSPVQLIESHPIKLLVEQNLKYSVDPSSEEREDFKFEHMTNIDRKPESNGENDEENTLQTYFSLIGIRSLDKDGSAAYRYEIIVSGTFSIDTSIISKETNADDMAAKYSYTMLWGQAREMLVGMTSRMRNGAMVLPTMSFMDATFPSKGTAE